MLYHVTIAALAVSVIAGNTVTSGKSQNNTVVFNTTCNGANYVYQHLAGYGYIPYSAIDSHKDTIGGIGSSAAIEKKSWKKIGKDKYTGFLWTLPDRGFNVIGTINYQPRVHKYKITFDASVKTGTPSNGNVKLDYQESVYFTDPNGVPMTGLDASFSPPGVHATFAGFPDLPVVTYTGDGFGGNGTGGTRVPLDSEGLKLADDGSFWVSDEYGPYLYKFNSNGKMIDAIRPPNALIPLRNGTESFSADSPPVYDLSLHPIPSDPTSGRQNNQGFEGLTASPDGKTVYTLIQSALRQDGGRGGSSNRYYARFLAYDVSTKPIKPKAEYVVRLPVDSTGRTAAQSEIHYISDTQFFVLARDSNRGSGQTDTKSLYRHADVFDISKATNILGKYDDFNQSIVTNVTTAALKGNITAAAYCTFLDYNVNSELNKFGLHNGGAQDFGLLNEKWESFALVPVDPDRQHYGKGNGSKTSDEYFLFTLSDNDFRALDGKFADIWENRTEKKKLTCPLVYVNGGKTVLHDTVNLNNQLLVFKVTLPSNAKPLVG